MHACLVTSGVFPKFSHLYTLFLLQPQVKIALMIMRSFTIKRKERKNSIKFLLEWQNWKTKIIFYGTERTQDIWEQKWSNGSKGANVRNIWSYTIIDDNVLGLS